MADNTPHGLLRRIGWSKSELARRCDVHPNTVTNWMKKPPRILILYLTCVAGRMGE